MKTLIAALLTSILLTNVVQADQGQANSAAIHRSVSSVKHDKAVESSKAIQAEKPTKEKVGYKRWDGHKFVK